MKIEFDTRAETELLRIVEWIAADNPAAAVGVRASIEGTIANLADFPRMAPRRGRRGWRELLVSGLPCVVYRVDRDTVRIVSVVHAARDRPR